MDNYNNSSEIPFAMGSSKRGESRFSPLGASADLLRAPHINQIEITGAFLPVISGTDFSTQRLQFCIILIAIVHLLVIFGIRWHNNTFLDKNNSSRTLEVTLATKPTSQTPDKAELMAPFAQEAIGPQKPHFAEQQKNTVWQPSAQLENQQPLNEVVTAKNAAEKTAINAVEANTTDANMLSTPQEALDQRVASLRAELEQQQDQYNQQLKIRTVTAATLASADAEYLYEWRAKIERVGNLNYPEEARLQKLHGDVLLLVAINADGSLREVQIRQSSGNKILDEAAMRIVRLAAPFPPLPPEVRKDTDVLEIIRTWQFGKDNRWYAT
jgi:protein TonB